MDAGTPKTVAEGRFTLTRSLGEGGMAVVYECYDHDLKVWRALKFLKPEMASKRALRRRFMGEAMALARLEHPNVVRIHDVGEADGRPYLVMSMTRGGSLESYLSTHGPMDPNLAVRAMIQVCAGVSAAHDAGIIHRDLKPDNVLIALDGTCKVTDFGIAILDDTQRSTRTGSVMGTLGYMAPEHHRDAKHLSVQADVFSIGATMFALLTGETPSDMSLAQYHPELVQNVPELLRPVVIRATSFKPEDRYASTRELQQALEELLPHTVARPDAPPLPHLAVEPRTVPPREVLQAVPVAAHPPEAVEIPAPRVADPTPAPPPEVPAGIEPVTPSPRPAATHKAAAPRRSLGSLAVVATLVGLGSLLVGGIGVAAVASSGAYRLQERSEAVFVAEQQVVSRITASGPLLDEVAALGSEVTALRTVQRGLTGVDEAERLQVAQRYVEDVGRVLESATVDPARLEKARAHHASLVEALDQVSAAKQAWNQAAQDLPGSLACSFGLERCPGIP